MKTTLKPFDMARLCAYNIMEKIENMKGKKVFPVPRDFKCGNKCIEWTKYEMLIARIIKSYFPYWHCNNKQRRNI